MSRWKLYWVESDGYEDCFVVAKSSRSAASVELNMNDFNKDEVKATRIKDIPDKFERIANYLFLRWSRIHAPEQVKKSNLNAWPWYARKWLLKAVGAKFRDIDGDEQILLSDRVYGHKPSGEWYVYSIGVRAIAERRNEAHSLKYENGEELDLKSYIFSAMGIALSQCHEIEYLLSNSFIFGISDEQKRKYDTINDLINGWNKKTFGQILRLVQNTFEIESTLKSSLDIFLEMRNKLVHGITGEERYNIHDEWGQKELISFLDIFLTLAEPIKEIALSSYVTSMQFGIEILKNDGVPVVELPKGSIEKLSVFFEYFIPKNMNI